MEAIVDSEVRAMRCLQRLVDDQAALALLRIICRENADEAACLDAIFRMLVRHDCNTPRRLSASGISVGDIADRARAAAIALSAVDEWSSDAIHCAIESLATRSGEDARRLRSLLGTCVLRLIPGSPLDNFVYELAAALGRARCIERLSCVSAEFSTAQLIG